MSPNRLKQIEGLYHLALEQPEDRRESWLEAQSPGDESLRAEVKSLLRENGAGGLLGEPALDAAGAMMAAGPSGFAVGARLNQYQIRSMLGKGGMGEVYRAHDTKLQRDVAIKILPTEFAGDSDRLARFQREARTLASLNHPNISTIHDLQESDGTRFLVLELVEGETLADLLKRRGALPVDAALEIAMQICEALAAAHQKGVIHRDLKPSNIQVTSDRKIKLLDFGLARLTEPIHGQDLSKSPTASLSIEGALVGTPAYMSPEQARGEEADHRSDIWALGAVLFEMLTGKPAFAGDSVTEILGLVVTAEPDWDLLPAAAPSLVAILRRCLKKKSRERLQSAADIRLFLIDAPIHTQTDHALNSRSGMPRLWWIVGASALATVLVASIFVLTARRRNIAPVDHAVISFTIPEPPHAHFVGGEAWAPHAAVSPDGKYVVFQALADGDNSQMLWLRALNGTDTVKIRGTEQGNGPFWSPDSRFIAFFAQGKIWKIDVAGGVAQPLADVPPAFEPFGAWGPDGTILFSAQSSIQRVPSVGGSALPATATSLMLARDPEFLPDGRHFIYLTLNTEKHGPSAWTVNLASIDSVQSQPLIDVDSRVAFANGHLLFMRDGALMAQAFDLELLAIKGDPFSVAQDVRHNPSNARAAFTVSDSGVLVYRTGKVGGMNELTWMDRSGKATRSDLPPGNYQGLDLSPDGNELAIHRHEGIGGDIWIMDLPRGTSRRFTFDISRHFSTPWWSPDASQLTYDSVRPPAIFVKPANGLGEDRLVYQWPITAIGLENVDSWAPDGKSLLIDLMSVDPINGLDLWILTLPDGKIQPYLESPENQMMARFSPNGHWVAFVSTQGGTRQVFVRPFPNATSGVWQISLNGGSQPQWRGDGREIFYIAPNNDIMSVDVEPDGAAPRIGAPRRLFSTRAESPGTGHNSYTATRDGQRFLVISRPENEGLVEPRLTVVVNWLDSVKPTP